MQKPASTPSSSVRNQSRRYRKAPWGRSLHQRFALLPAWFGNCHLTCGLPLPFGIEARPAPHQTGLRLQHLGPCVHLDIYYSDRY
ncbi:hypothetical protein GMLC_22050 [Geomonas limicola]|uniref:Uncharacterized protein n=1 Tax=Geomonas limicola TaxID=2740186 RepID=A0A6V8N7S4_9BACT|nr:hypothetical protein GMLC_22050 [Geomonas limicola]